LWLIDCDWIRVNPKSLLCRDLQFEPLYLTSFDGVALRVAGLCACTRACAGAAESLNTYIHTTSTYYAPLCTYSIVVVVFSQAGHLAGRKPQLLVRRETGHTHKHMAQQPTTTHDKNNTTNNHTKNHPTSLNNDRRWRGDGAYHLPHPVTLN